ncbi:MAG: gamma-glutamyltransferase [Gammaproteobacteria bacterium]|nr:MAG: gamma-glutamyltransferase [Gammaproteobacteria bacterium]
MYFQDIGFINNFKAHSLLTVISVILIFTSASSYGEPPIIEYGDRFHPVVGGRGMVVSQEILASQTGAAILAAGGNAVDAAVATGFALAVTLPQAGNLGGGGFMLVYLASENKTIAIDYREVAPLAAVRDLFLDKNGEVDKNKARFSYLSAGVPGTVAGLIHAQQNYGSLSLADVLAPAIKLAEQGIRVSYPLAYSLNRAQQRLIKWPASRKYYFGPDGTPLQAGSLWRQADLASTLKALAKEGRDAFYQGRVAELIIADMNQNGGLITRQDLADYRVIEREALVGTYRGYDIAAMPPPSSGGVHLLQMLNILEGWKLTELGHNSAEYIHRLIETMRRAYADRSKYLGDPDFYPVPVADLIDKSYGTRLREGINLDHATPSSDIAPGLNLPEESPQTTHFSVWDNAGNVVSNTYTINFSYGSGIAVEGAGFLLNNEMDDFSAKSGVPNAYGLLGGQANAIEPKKRPLSSMTPVIVFKGGEPVFTTGSPGGSTIITTVLQTVLNVVDFEMNIAEAAAAARIHHQWLPDTVFIETGISLDTQRLLVEKGHDLQKSRRVIGRTQTISSDGEYTYGANDYRWPGGAAIAEPSR